MIEGNDTLLYKEKVQIIDGDTTYLIPCHTLKKINGQIINFKDINCLRQGLWIKTDSLGNYWKGTYKNNKQIGIWKKFDKNGNLLKITERVYVGKDSYLVKKIKYSNGTPIVLIDKPFLAFYIKNLILIFIIILGSFFSRAFINSQIYNIEQGTNLSLFQIRFPFSKKYNRNFGFMIKCLFTMWFFNYKPENRKRVIISNTLSGIALGLFFGCLMGLAVTGNLN